MDRKEQDCIVCLEGIPKALEVLFEDAAPGVSAPSLAVRILDQTLLPEKELYRDIDDPDELIEAIKTLAVRGAPALGVAGVAGVLLALWHSAYSADANLDEGTPAQACIRLGERMDEVMSAPEYASVQAHISAVEQARPTAVNLGWGVRRGRALLDDLYAQGATYGTIIRELYALTKRVIDEDLAANRLMGAHGAQLLPHACTVMTHCNAGSLATAFFGTALGVIYTAYAEGKIEMVYSCETRPLGQGARLTVWELSRAHVPVTLICDDMAAFTMKTRNVDAVIVGADRIARNGDVANKIGTYGLALMAHALGIPFYVAAPISTIDPTCTDGSMIPIEYRSAREVLARPIEGVSVLNPAFDVTPASLITNIITEAGVFAPEEIATYLSSEEYAERALKDGARER